MFRRLLRHLQGELYRMLKTTVTLFYYIYEVVLYMGIYSLTHNYLKSHIWFNVKLKTLTKCVFFSNNCK